MLRELIPNRLWIGSRQDLHDIRNVLSCGIAAIIDLAMDEPPVVYPREIVSCRFPLVDGAGNPPNVIRAAIQTAITLVNGGVATFIGCSAGMSRAPCIAAAVVVMIERAEPDDALQRIVANDPHDVSPDLWAEIKLVLPSCVGSKVDRPGPVQQL